MIIYGTHKRNIFTRVAAQVLTTDQWGHSAWIKGTAKREDDGSITAWVTDPRTGQTVKAHNVDSGNVRFIEG